MDKEPTLKSIDRKKEREWEEKIKELKKPDIYGYVIEPGIIETVAALQLLGFDTFQSDEGDEKNTPWVELGTDIPKDIYIGEAELKIEIMERLKISPDEIDQANEKFNREKQVVVEETARDQLENDEVEYTEKYTNWDNRLLEIARNLNTIIDDFYERQGNPEIFIDFPYNSSKHPTRIKNIPFLRAKPETDEMLRFTEYLKKKFFSGDY